MLKKSFSKPRHRKMLTKRLADTKLALKLNIYDHKPKVLSNGFRLCQDCRCTAKR